MQLSGNTILVTGGGTGIGRGLAEALHRRGNQVVLAGRRTAVLAEVAGANPGMAWIEMDVADAGSIVAACATVVADHPALNVVINSAGVQTHEGAGPVVDDGLLTGTMATNFFGSIRVTNALLPHLLRQPSATVVNVTSMLGDLPLAAVSAYCASKAALHSFTLSLRHKLRDTNIAVLELAPPYVRTALAKDGQDPLAMPLDAFIEQTMAVLETDTVEVLVPGARKRRDTLRNAELEAMTQFNEMMKDF